MTLTVDRLRYLDQAQLLMLHKAYMLGERSPENVAFLDAIMREQASRNAPEDADLAACCRNCGLAAAWHDDCFGTCPEVEAA